MKTKPLIIVDFQDDFVWGSLAVPGAIQALPSVVDLANDASVVIATQDWHPHNHISFVGHGGTWPVHCVQDTKGARLLPAIDKIAEVGVRKGMEIDKEAYSGFANNSLFDMLAGYTAITICGLATDYCVKATVLDALHDFHVTVPLAACRGVDPETTAAAIEEMREKGAVIIDA